MVDVIHAVLTDYGRFGWGLTSPQLPELIGGRDSLEDLRRDLDEMLRFGGAADGATVEVHYQRYVLLPDGVELLVRVADRSDAAQRLQTMDRLRTALMVDRQVPYLLNGPRTVTGELLFVCAEPDDALGWLLAQLDAGDGVTMVASWDNERIFTARFHPSTDADRSYDSLASLGLSTASTVADLISAVPTQDLSAELVLA